MKNEYCELHCHTHYSLLDGASSPEALLDRAIELGMPALAITDHTVLVTGTLQREGKAISLLVQTLKALHGHYAG